MKKKIVCPYCHEENEVDINGGDSFICESKNCKKEVKIVKVDNISLSAIITFFKNHWIIISILFVLVVFTGIYAIRSNSALKNVNEELSKKLNTKTEELNKEIAKNASESQQLHSEIEKLKQEKSALASQTEELNEVASESQQLNSEIKELNKVIAQNASESELLNSNIENYILAKKCMDEGKYKEAVSIFEKIDSFLDSKAQIVICNNNINYSNAINHLENKEYDTAKAIFEELGEFKDSKNKLDESNCNINLNKIKKAEVGDIVTFGSYEQDLKKDGKEPIEWIILEKNASDSKALLLSKYGLESMNYHDSNEPTNWASCWIRDWLNCEFYNNAFNLYEVPKINRQNIMYDVFYGSYSTRDRVFLLSEIEFDKFYTKSAQQDKLKPVIICEPTEMVKTHNDLNSLYPDYNNWRLRAKGIRVENNMYKAVDKNGNVLKGYINAFYTESIKNKGLIRPAICIKFGEE